MHHATDASTATVLLGLSVMTALGSVFAGLAKRWRQPAVIGEIIAGIMLGPALLGWLPGKLTQHLFPNFGRPYLTVLANLGLVLFMFVVGFELDPGKLRRGRSAVLAVSLGSILLPFALGAATAAFIYPWHKAAAAHHGGWLAFVLFMAVAMSITAFPVLARILSGFGLQNSSLGTFVLACAATADVIAWAMLAVVVTLVTDGGSGRTVASVGGVVIFVAIIAFVVRPGMRAVLANERVRRHGTGAVLPVVIVGLLLSAWATTELGFHPIFGAFAFGAIMPRDAIKKVAPDVPRLVEQASFLLVPVFFITAGLNANLAGLGGWHALEAGLILVVACTGKFVGAAGAAKACGMDLRRSATIGVLMNCRGLTELVVIQVGISMGILDSRLAAMMILMAVVTTVAASPLFRKLYNEPIQWRDNISLRAHSEPSTADEGVAPSDPELTVAASH
jgi:Kef-type K+ transport system membrane component KefB